MQITKLVAIDVETSGFSKGGDVTANHQIVAIGLVVADRDFNALDKLYCEIKPNGTSHWDHRAEKVHGLSQAYLEKNGMDEDEAVEAILTFLLKHFSPSDYIYFLGHNAKGFDVPFFNKLINKFDIYLNIGHRTVDSFSIGFTCFGTENSDDTFNLFFPHRKEHNALDDAMMALGVCKNVRIIIEEAINGA